jgi:translation initiation factor 2-alpha kinase 4
MRQHEAEERQRRERGNTQQKRSLPPGTLEDRKITFPAGRRIIVGDSGVPCDTWIAYGAGRRDGLWMLYDVEGVVADINGGYENDHGITALKRKIPVCSLQVIDFAATYYTTSPGKKRVEAMFSDLENLVAVRHPNLAAVYAVKVSTFS